MNIFKNILNAILNFQKDIKAIREAEANQALALQHMQESIVDLQTKVNAIFEVVFSEDEAAAITLEPGPVTEQPN